MKLSLSIIVGLLAVIAFLAWRLNSVSADRDSTAAVLQEKTAEITYLKAESGKTIASKPAAEISKTDLQKHYRDVTADLQDMNVKLNSVRAVLKAVVEATGEGKVIIVRDTIELPGHIPFIQDSVFIDDNYLRLKAQVIPGTNESFLAYKYTYSDSILFTLSTERKWFLGKKKLIGQVRMSNPNSRSTGQTSILIRERQKRFNISAGVSYLPFENRFAPTVTAGYSLIRF